MWKPVNHLRPEVIKALREAEFSEDKIEFLGWLTQCASALNANKHNVVKAAHTLLAKDTITPLIPKFIEKKKDSVRPTVVADTHEADNLFRDFKRWKDKNIPEMEEGDPYAPEE